jgi:DNA-directed RNA polymerase specialized sigma24 family protein
LPVLETPKDDRVLTERAFARLLTWLDDGKQSNGETYLEMRRRLVAYFDRRNRPSADELADETLNRIARTLETSGEIKVTPPARYCYVVARFVLLEDFRRGRTSRTVEAADWIESLPGQGPAADGGDGIAAMAEARLDCLDRCLQELRPDQRELVLEYYRDTKREKIERRRALAERLGISMNALGIRACRIRDTLEGCVTSCRQAPGRK